MPKPSLSNDRVHLWYFDLAKPLPKKFQLNCLSKEDQILINNKAFDLLKERARSGRIALRNTLSEYLQQKPKDIVVHKTPSGKPYLPDFPEISFNLSHSQNHFVLAVADFAVGIDIEVLKRKPDTKLANRFFSSEEAQWLESVSEPDKNREFLKLWTRKEAAIKLLDLTIGDKTLKESVLDLENESQFFWLSKEIHYHSLKDMDYVGCLCTQNPQFQIVSMQVDY